MSDSFFDSSWYRVSGLYLQLRSHAKIHRQQFRGQTWHVVQDQQTGKYHRITPAAHLFISMMDGNRTINEIWNICGQQLKEDQPSQGEVIKLLSQLHQANILLGTLPPDINEIATRAVKIRRSNIRQRFKNPLGIRIPVFDPDQFLTRSVPWLSWLFGPIGIILWLLVVTSGGILAVLNWDALSVNVADRVLVGNNVLQMIIAYCLIKAVHELGHAYAAKRWGGEIHEIGLMFLVFMPVPYVDASCSSAFQSKWQRAGVGAAGILVELFIASCAMLVWTSVDSGIVHANAYNVMVIAGVSTLLFNGNPLLRFDGYYVFSDLIEIPNLGKRSNDYVFYLIKSRWLGIKNLTSPANAPGEESWFVFYSLASFIYRMSLMAWICFYLLTEIPMAGMVLALWMFYTSLLKPIYTGINFLLTNPTLHLQRRRKIFSSSILIAVILLIVFATPLPHATIVEGYLWVPEDAILRAESEGTIITIVASPNSDVDIGASLIKLEDPLLDARIEIAEAEREQLLNQIKAVQFVDQVQKKMFREQLQRVNASLEYLRAQAADRIIKAKSSGLFAIVAPENLQGQFLHRGSSVGYVIDDKPIVNVLINQDDINLVRNNTRRIDIRFSQHFDQIIPAKISRQTPAAVDTIPNLVLSLVGGGTVALDPSDAKNRKMLEPMFQLELSLDQQALDQQPLDHTIGGRAYVRFDHGYSPLLPRLIRRLRQVFLGTIDA